MQNWKQIPNVDPVKEYVLDWFYIIILFSKYIIRKCLSIVVNCAVAISKVTKHDCTPKSFNVQEIIKLWEIALTKFKQKTFWNQISNILSQALMKWSQYRRSGLQCIVGFASKIDFASKGRLITGQKMTDSTWLESSSLSHYCLACLNFQPTPYYVWNKRRHQNFMS
jgi:hypothetical protein